jgi:hypothetical protein
VSDRTDDRDEALITCAECGRTSEDETTFTLCNVEEANYSMDDPYPGSDGEYYCADGCPDVAWSTQPVVEDGALVVTHLLWENSSRLTDLPAGTEIPGIGEV